MREAKRNEAERLRSIPAIENFTRNTALNKKTLF